jgi:hypothetical protein
VKKHILVGVCFVVLPICLPLFLQPKLAGFLIFHSTTGLELLAAPFLIAFCYALGQIRKESPRPPDQKIILIGRTQLGLVLAALAVMAIVGANSYSTMRTAQELQTNGRQAFGQLGDTYADSCGKNGCTEGVRFSYKVAEKLYEGHETLGKSAIDELEYTADQRGGAIPIVYDPAQPTVSAINLDNRVMLRNPASAFQISFSISAVIVGFLAGLFFLLLRAQRQELEQKNQLAPGASNQLERMSPAHGPVFGRRRTL